MRYQERELPMIRNPLSSPVAVAFLIPCLALAEVGEADFSLDTTRNLHHLCATPSDHADYAPAIYSCRAFLEATVQYHDAVSDGKTLKRLICYPSTATLEDARVAFLAWANANARDKALMNEMPVLGVVRALEDKYPCKG
jgi:hypothetical protein